MLVSSPMARDTGAARPAWTAAWICESRSLMRASCADRHRGERAFAAFPLWDLCVGRLGRNGRNRPRKPGKTGRSRRDPAERQLRPKRPENRAITTVTTICAPCRLSRHGHNVPPCVSFEDGGGQHIVAHFLAGVEGCDPLRVLSVLPPKHPARRECLRDESGV
jgi:hypothetical protein